ncbi:hypothetical protein pEaSNUABM35_00190 [Erwinia phage pEa_SNUABM_35]|uniref:Uncharacterized protein n=1 Tax=Erwinia phage pEa_SNUABM_35 TaxID=2869557 RepID=A0AAE7XR48_9CAUD|nr:hypothetical protein MPK65_gp190 [Erwinia phage pEa_SNUABM_35]QZE60107.1 hypothetical protein pEaSNUABM35_00190 [Erwinia phage pEa_SNUABM_35]QZE60443.1 hypothetical protein pEaSNUABM36_00190 [Erwinia phage pEa_SNUABM_36]
MSLIKINLAEAVASESAAKKPAYKIAKVGGASTLVVNSAKKGELQAVVGHLKKAKTAAVSGITASIKANTAATKANQLPRGDKRTKLMATRKAEKAKAAADLKTAKAELREANKVAKAHGLGGLNLPLSAADIKTGVGAEKALKAIRSAKLTEFGVTGKRGAFKPKFLKEAAFDAVGTKAAKPKVRVTDTDRKNAKAPFKRNKGIVAGAKTPARAKAAKMDPGELSAKVHKALPDLLDTVGIKFNTKTKSGDVTYNAKGLKGKAIGKNNIVMTELRMHLEDKKIPVQKNRDGFEIPGVIRFTQSDAGVKFERLDK